MIPLIGAFDAMRASDMTERLLSAIQAERASYLILDITGVGDIDTVTANHFLRIVQATRLLGAETVITGLRPRWRPRWSRSELTCPRSIRCAQRKQRCATASHEHAPHWSDVASVACRRLSSALPAPSPDTFAEGLICRPSVLECLGPHIPGLFARLPTRGFVEVPASHDGAE